MRKYCELSGASKKYKNKEMNAKIESKANIGGILESKVNMGMLKNLF